MQDELDLNSRTALGPLRCAGALTVRATEAPFTGLGLIYGVSTHTY